MARKKGTGTLYKQKRGGKMVWYGQITVDVHGVKKRKAICLDTEDKALAAAKLKRELDAIARQRPVEPVAVGASLTTVRDFAELWLDRAKVAGQVSASDDAQRLNKFILPSIGDMPIADVKARHVKPLLEAAAETVSRETVKKIRNVTLRLFKEAWSEDLYPSKDELEKTKVVGTAKPKKQRAVCTDEEFAIYLADPRADIEVKMLSIASRTVGGMRTGDLNQWDWQAIDLVNFETATVPRSKTDTPQALELPASIRGFLRAWWERHGSPTSGPIFPARTGDNAGGFKKESSYAKRFRKALQRALGPTARPELFTETATTLPVDFHSWRRAYCGALAEADVNVQKATHLAGHADVKTHLGYVAKTKAMQRAPEAVMPKLPDALPLLLPSPLAFQSENDEKPACSLRFERRAGGLEGRCSIQLSYEHMSPKRRGEHSPA